VTPLTVLVGIYSPFAAWNIPAAHVERLRRELPHHTFLHAPSEQRALDMIPSAEVAFMSELRPAHLSAAPRLRWVHSPAAGVGGMLFPAMIESPVVVTNSRGISAGTIAEHVLAVMLARFRKLSLAFHSQSLRQWAQEAFVAQSPLRTIAGARVLVVGLGSIGSATASRLIALGARVTATRRTPTQPAPEGVEAIVPPDRLHELLPGADVVVIAAPQTRETRALIGAPELAAMRRDALLVNVSRGRLVDEAALVAALTNTPTLAAALDVFEEEPLPPTSPLWALPNVLITPHISGFRPDHWDAVTELFADNLRRFDAGQPLLNIVNKDAGY
jgi:phosphoglycerate dehydrogenase-like enzyme